MQRRVRRLGRPVLALFDLVVFLGVDGIGLNCPVAELYAGTYFARSA